MDMEPSKTLKTPNHCDEGVPMSRLFACAGLGIALLAGLSVSSSWAADAPAGRFTDITAESGVAALVEAHYQAVPKWWLSGMTLVDFDGDGKLDLHLAGHGYPAVAARNDGKGRFARMDPRLDIPRGKGRKDDLPYGGGEIRLMFDLLERGRQDMLASYGDGLGVTYLNDCKAGDSAASWNFKPYDAGFDAFSRAVAFADLNGDGRVDYLIDGSGDTLLVLYGKGEGRWQRGMTVKALRESGAIPADLTGSGRLDLLVSQRGYNKPGRCILRNDGQGGFKDVTLESGLDAQAGSIHGVGDVNQDGALDLICVDGRDVVIYLNDGKGRFSKAPPIAGMDALRNRPHETNWGGAVVTDIDNDGVPDVLVNGKAFLYVLRGLGGGRFEIVNDRWGIPTGLGMAVDEGLCFGDLDGDGMLDLVTAGRPPAGKERGVAVYRNGLPRKHRLTVQLIGKPGNRAATAAKIWIHESGSDGKRLLAFEQVAIWGRQSFHSYYFARNTQRHFGLGNRTAADVRVQFHPSGRKVHVDGAKADTTIDIRED
jgi:hypothetical protein